MGFEMMLAFHCGPAMAGIKPANLISCSRERYPRIDEEIGCMNRRLNGSGIYFDILCRCKNRSLIIVYRKEQLSRCLGGSEISALLRSIGYPDGGLDVKLEHLRQRLAEDGEFPHEIGAFLGYPPEDIYGFINKERELYTGYWKVYSNPERTLKLFRRYDSCRLALIKRLISGKTLADIFGAA